ncbi:hypothetical protein G7Z17_g1099 [Cylindrodendrum hubeiense]|uniref:Uncharacterized protein n=1 Tax=Cylindrodendrum hubeiense TaxID=595255 RepID=A0A9P5LLP3_9HYPO|nr:hypothetical protein G7Z17_g1099 [Cylindrodendrum hubeiense]
MWAHIARHGLVMKTHKTHFDELRKTLELDALDTLTNIVAVGFLLRTLKEKTRSLKDQQILVCEHTVAGKVVGVYPHWVQAWAHPDWNGDIKKPSAEKIITTESYDDDDEPLAYEHLALLENKSGHAGRGGKVDPVVMRARHEVMRRVGNEVRGIHISRIRLSDRFEDPFSRQRASKLRSSQQKAAEMRAADTRLAKQIISEQGASYHGTAEQKAAGHIAFYQNNLDNKYTGQPIGSTVRNDGNQEPEATAEQADTGVFLAEAEVANKQDELQDITRKVTKWKEIDDFTRKIIAANKERDRLDSQIMKAKMVIASFPYVLVQRLTKEGLGHIFPRDWLTVSPASSDAMLEEPRLDLVTLMRGTSNKMEARCQAKARQLAEQLRINERRRQADQFAHRQAAAARPFRAKLSYAPSVAEEEERSCSVDRVNQRRLKPSVYSGGRFCARNQSLSQELDQKPPYAKPDMALQSLKSNLSKTPGSIFSGNNTSGSSTLGEPSTPVRPNTRRSNQSPPYEAFPSSPTLPLPQAPRPKFSYLHRQGLSPIPPPTISEEVENPTPRALSLYDVEQANTRFFAHLTHRLSQMEARPPASRARQSHASSRSVAAADVARQQLFTLMRENASSIATRSRGSGQNDQREACVGWSKEPADKWI